MTAAYWVWRRELAVMLRAPIIYLVGGLFLVVQGIAFAGLVGALSDPRRPAPLGALLEGQLGGTLLTWVLELVVLTLLGMRAIADDKRSGGWEALLTAGVAEPAAVVGKWLAAATVYAVVWLPTLGYLAVVAVFRTGSAGWDVPAIAVGYAGAIALGAALLAWAIAASAATASSLAAGALGFAALIGMFLVGELPSLWPELALDHPSVALALETVSLRAIATDFARGHVALRAVCVLGGITIVGLGAAITLACAGRRRTREIAIRGGGTLAIAVSAALVTVLAARHPAGVDLSAAGRNSLAEVTRDVLAGLPAPATLTIVQPTLGALEPIYDEVARTASRMADASAALIVRRTDPLRAPGELSQLARDAGLVPGDLAKGGAIVVELGGHRRVVDLLAFAAIDSGPDGAPVVERLAVEQAISGALAALAALASPAGRATTVCATRGHGELALVAAPGTPAVLPSSTPAAPAAGHDWVLVGDRLRAEGMALDDLEPGVLARGVPAHCSVVVVAGPAQPLAAGEALAIQRFVQGGGGLVAAVGGLVNGALPATGVEPVLAADGIGVADAITVDPALGVRERPGALYVIDGYADHPINHGFSRARLTLWLAPRTLVITGGARALVSASAASWGERDLVAAPMMNPDDFAGPVALAARGGARRIIAVSSAESFTSAALREGGSAGDLWLARAVRFASGAPEPSVAVASRAPEQLRLIMTPGQRRAVIALSVAGIPLAWALLGGVLVWWRRRAR